jgi:small-conductance mechanosensitive channel
MLAVFSGAVGLGIGLGLQRGISNLFTGMMLLLDKTIQPGDIIEMPDGTLGSVYHMGSRCTELRSLDNRSYLIPNEHLVSNQVINWSRGSTEVLQSVTFGVDYKHNPHDIIKIAIDATRGIPRILHDPICHFSGFGDSSLDFTLRFWIKDPENGTGGLKSEIYLALWDAFAKNNIEIPYPHRKVIHG